MLSLMLSFMLSTLIPAAAATSLIWVAVTDDRRE
ncbi:MAG: hypothetical protein QOG66_2309 [Methylobacteriaceae bacterium]|jgi:hypothetical protein|nr:hypothetical protein [Methylobacteriaceae bacterium]MEA2859802.1 hypothetical protein [Methylobacteriaceae bacterium]